MIQKLNIGIAEIKEFADNKDLLDAYTFAKMIKLTFVSGRIHNASIRRVSSILHVGNKTCKRLLNLAFQYGYIRREGKDIISNKSEIQKGDYVYPLTKILERKSERLSSTPICPFKFTKLRNEIRKIAIINHVAKQNDFCNTLDCSSNPHYLKEYKRANKRIKRMCKRSIAENTDRLSIKRMAQITGVSRATTKRLKKELVQSGILSETRNLEQTDIDIQQVLRMSYDDDNFKQYARHWLLHYSHNINSGYPVLRWHWIDESNCRLMVDIQYANSYRVNRNIIRVFV